MAQNVTTTSQTKHVDIRYKFVNKYVEDGIVKSIFVKSKENDADIFTKNLNENPLFTHSSKFVKIYWDNNDIHIWASFLLIR